MAKFNQLNRSYPRCDKRYDEFHRLNQVKTLKFAHGCWAKNVDYCILIGYSNCSQRISYVLHVRQIIRTTRECWIRSSFNVWSITAKRTVQSLIPHLIAKANFNQLAVWKGTWWPVEQITNAMTCSAGQGTTSIQYRNNENFSYRRAYGSTLRVDSGNLNTWSLRQ